MADEDMDAKIVDIEAQDRRYKALLARRDALRDSKAQIEAELGARRRRLKDLMDEAKAAGFDPNNLQEEISKGSEVLRVKLDNFEAEIDAGEKELRPMLEEIRKGD